MLAVDIPGYGNLSLEHLVLDYNGTLAVDGMLLPGVKPALNALAGSLTVHVVTADTFGKAAAGLEGIDCQLSVLPPGKQDQAKADVIHKLSPDRTVCIGNGRNDALMLSVAALGIAVILGEGASAITLAAADVVCTDIVCALELLIHPLRLTATLRS